MKSRLTQESLAEAAGIHPTYVGMIERGVRKPTLDAAARIAASLQIPLWKLIKATEDEEHSKKTKR